MQMQTKSNLNRVEILASKDYDAVPVTISGTDKVKAGSPITSAGAVATTESQATGILLYDVDPVVNPNGSLVVRGIINARIARQYSGRPLVKATIEGAVPGLILRENAPLRYTNQFLPPTIALTVSSSAGTASGDTALTVSGYTLGTGESWVYKVGTAILVPHRGETLTGWTAWDGSDDITAATNTKITVAAVDAQGRAIASGGDTVTAKA